jgi:hypothetical protein
MLSPHRSVVDTAAAGEGRRAIDRRERTGSGRRFGPAAAAAALLNTCSLAGLEHRINERRGGC